MMFEHVSFFLTWYYNIIFSYIRFKSINAKIFKSSIYYTLANNALQPTCMPPKHIYVRETLSPVQKV